MKKPAYLCVYKSLKSNIIEGEYKIGSLIPPEPALCDMYGVSRTTIRKAVEMLIKDGFITVKQGFGTQVISQKTNQNLNCLTSISQTLKVKGYEIGVKNVYIEELKADRNLAQEFDVEIGTPLIADGLYAEGESLFLSKIKPGYRKSNNKPERPLLGRMGLHARSSTIQHPRSREDINIEAQYPMDLAVALRQLRR